MVWPLEPAELYHEVRVMVESPSFSEAATGMDSMHQEVGYVPSLSAALGVLL